MLNRFRDRFGTAGLVLAVIALIAALGGTALAKGLFTKSQEKQIAKIAKKEAKKYANSNPGSPGAPGANGKDGAPGQNGQNGAPGAPGKSVTEAPATPAECSGVAGGKKYTLEGGATTTICNGKNGTNGQTGFTEVLPPEKTETGAWSLEHHFECSNEIQENPDTSKLECVPASAGIIRTTASFPIPLATPLDGSSVHLILNNDKELTPTFEEVESAFCLGTVSEPSAEPGQFCLYSASELLNLGNLTYPLGIAPGAGMQNPATGAAGTGTTGVLISGVLQKNTEVEAHGTWAVTAPEE